MAQNSDFSQKFRVFIPDYLMSPWKINQSDERQLKRVALGAIGTG
jgi:chromosome condensin MukBEF complex kleisin-like MukF subunit